MEPTLPDGCTIHMKEVGILWSRCSALWVV